MLEYYLYILKDDRDNYKIGISRNPFLREGEIKTHNPTAKLLFYRGYIGGNVSQKTRDDEKILHNKFQNKRLWGEWFKLNKRDITKIWNFFGYSWMPSGGKFIGNNEALKIFDLNAKSEIEYK